MTRWHIDRTQQIHRSVWAWKAHHADHFPRGKLMDLAAQIPVLMLVFGHLIFAGEVPIFCYANPRIIPW